jgi:hypothetical protein
MHTGMRAGEHLHTAGNSSQPVRFHRRCSLETIGGLGKPAYPLHSKAKSRCRDSVNRTVQNHVRAKFHAKTTPIMSCRAR